MSAWLTGWSGRSAWPPYPGAVSTWNRNAAGGRSASPSPRRWRRCEGPPIGSNGSSALPDVSRLSEPVQHEPIRALERVRLCRQSRPLPRLQGGRCPALPLYRMWEPGSRPGRSRGGDGDRPGGAGKPGSRVRLSELRRALQRAEGSAAGRVPELWSDVPGRGSVVAIDPADDLGQYLTGLPVDNNCGDLIEGCRFGVHDDEIRAVRAGPPRNSRRWVHLQRAAHNEHHVGRHG